MSAICFDLVREITISGFSADPEPNVTPPADSAVYDVPGKVGDQAQSGQVAGVALKGVYVDNAGAFKTGGTFDFTLWYKDEGPGGFWTKRAPAAGAAANLEQGYGIVGKVFVQVTALSAASGGTKLRLYAAARTSLSP